MRTTAYLKAITEVFGKTITGLGPIEQVNFIYTHGNSARIVCIHQDLQFNYKENMYQSNIAILYHIFVWYRDSIAILFFQDSNHSGNRCILV